MNETSHKCCGCDKKWLFILIFLILTAINYGIFFLKNRPPSGTATRQATEIPEVSLKSKKASTREMSEVTSDPRKLILVADVALYKNGVKEPGMAANLYVTLPENSTVSGKNVKISGVLYNVMAPSFEGACPLSDDPEAVMSTATCGYTDESVEFADVFRVWKRKNQVFGLNPITLMAAGFGLDSILVTKSGDGVFNVSEVNMWKKIFATLEAEIFAVQEKR